LSNIPQDISPPDEPTFEHEFETNQPFIPTQSQPLHINLDNTPPSPAHPNPQIIFDNVSPQIPSVSTSNYDSTRRLISPHTPGDIDSEQTQNLPSRNIRSPNVEEMRQMMYGNNILEPIDEKEQDNYGQQYPRERGASNDQRGGDLHPRVKRQNQGQYKQHDYKK
jgi:hypothetical protein